MTTLARAAMPTTDALDPARLKPHYRAFLTPHDGEARRILLTGHSHQAWPDAAKEGLLEAFAIAAARVDDKWDEVFAAQAELRTHVAARIGCHAAELAFG